MVRFLHTADWQLGMTRHFLGDEGQARFAQARFDAIRTLGRVASERGCEFVVVCGDVFESNQVDRRTVARALEALGAVPIPVYLLPGNHDALDAGSVFRSRAFQDSRPANVHVLEDSRPVVVRPGVEIVGAPWTSRRPLRDLCAAACDGLEPRDGVVRVLVGHGAVDTLSPSRDDPALISVAPAEAALASGAVNYAALGDRHSATSVGASGRIRYAGAPEPTDYDEERPGRVLVVDCDESRVEVDEVPVASWTFVRRGFDLAGEADIDSVARWFADLPAKECTVAKVWFVGTLTLRQHARLTEALERARDVFAAVEVWERSSDLAVVPDDGDFADLTLAGFARAAVDRLRAAPDAEARDALALLVRLARRSA